MILFNLLFLIFLQVVIGDESHYLINSNKALHSVDERFLSISIDPGLLFSGISLNYRTIELAKNLQPAYFRIAGPSTSYLQFISNNTKLHINQDEKLVFTPAMWWSLNEFIQRTNFTPIFALNDVDSNWNKEWHSLLDMSALMNINCFWQIGFDCSQSPKSFDSYKSDIQTLRELLNAFPAKKDVWQVVGSDLSKCLPSQHAEMLRIYLEQLKDVVHAVMWKDENKEKTSAAHFITGNPIQKVLSVSRPHIPIWTSSAKLQHSVTFQDAINWAVEIGKAAHDGFHIIFRQVRLQELFADTSAYWISVYHKMLMGRTVLDAKSTSLTAHPNNYVYAHCTKNQNMFSVRGAMTVMAINNQTISHKISLRYHINQIGNTEIQSYIFQQSENGLDVLMNGETLKLDKKDMRFQPKIRRAKAITHLSFDMPPKSIGFFVFPTARLSACINNEDDTDFILAEMHQLQQLDFPEQQKSSEISMRVNKNAMSNGFSQMFKQLQKEIDDDKKLFNHLQMKPVQKYGNDEHISNSFERFMNKTTDLKKIDLKNLFGKDNDVRANAHVEILEKIPAYINISSKNNRDEFNLRKEKLDLDMKIPFKLVDSPKIDLSFDGFKKNKSNLSLPKVKSDLLKERFDLDFSSGEILKILTDRAKAKVEKRLGLSNPESIFQAKVRTKRIPRGGGHRGHGRNGKPKRDINMALLRARTEGEKKSGNKWTSKLARFKDNDLSDYDDDKGFSLPRMDSILPKKDNKFVLPTLPPLKPKKTLFSSPERDAAFPSFDLPTIPGLSSLFTFKPFYTTTESYKTLGDGYDSGEFEELGDALNTQQGYFDDFPDEFIDPEPKSYSKPHSHDELWEFEGGKPFQREFILDDDRNIQKTIDFLENYFNDRDKESYKSFDDSAIFERRRKRDVQSFLKRNDKQNLYKRKKARINDAKMKLMKSKLAQRKSLLKLKEKRRYFRKRNTPFNEIYVPKINFTNRLFKNYEPQMEKLKEWQPEDILNVPKLEGKFNVDSRSAIAVKEMPISRNGLRRREERSIYDGVNSIENEIDGNDIKKLSKSLLMNKFVRKTTPKSNIQKIPATNGSTFVDKIFKQINTIMNVVHKKLNDFLRL